MVRNMCKVKLETKHGLLGISEFALASGLALARTASETETSHNWFG